MVRARAKGTLPFRILSAVVALTFVMSMATVGYSIPPASVNGDPSQVQTVTTDASDGPSTPDVVAQPEADAAAADEQKPEAPAQGAKASGSFASVAALPAVNVKSKTWEQLETLPAANWINGNLNENNSRYYEGMSTPQRLVLEYNSAGTDTTVHSVTFVYGSMKSGKHAYDFLTSWAQAKATASSIGQQTFQDAWRWIDYVPADFVNNHATGTIPEDSHASSKEVAYEALYGDRIVDVFGNAPVGNVSVSTPIMQSNGDDMQLTVSWTGAATKVMVLFAGHVAVSSDPEGTGIGWGPGSGAGSIPGSPYHIALVSSTDWSGGSSMDNQLQASGVFLKSGVSGMKWLDANGNGVRDLPQDVGLAGWTIYDDVNNNGVLDAGEPSTVTTASGGYGLYKFLNANGSMRVREVAKDGYVQTYPSPGGFYTVSLTPGQFVSGKDFGNFEYKSGIHVNKVTNGADGLFIHAGAPVTWTYTVTNTGNVALSSVTVTDSIAGVSPAYVSGDTNSNSKLDLTETWVFEAHGTAITGAYSNIGTASGIGSLGDKVTSSDASDYFGSAPSIAINKVTNGSDGLYIHVGDAVTWTYTVTNTGNVPLSTVGVTDSKGIVPTYVSGDANSNGKLDLSESWVFTATGSAAAGAYDNIGTATGFGPANDKVTATDPSSYFGSNPGIAIVKLTNGADGLFVHFGDPVTWTYTVTNTGNVPLATVAVADSQPGVTPLYVSGDANSNGKLDLTEVWLFEAHGTAIGAPYSNVGTASGFGPASDKVTASDSSNYFGSNPAIHVDKVTNGSDGPFIHVGNAVTWTYTVTNAGNVVLHGVGVTDSVAGVSPAYVSGDTNSDGKLDLSETWVFEAHGTAIAGTYNNIGTATGFGPADDKVTATDPSNYFGSAPGIDIDKVTNGSDGPFIHVGAPVTWTYTVTNTGNVALSSVTVIDSVPGVSPVYVSGDANSNGKLDLTEAWVFEAHGTATAGAYSNVGTASGFGPVEDKVTATDPSNYFGSNPGIAINKVTNGSDGPFIHAGNAVTWTYTVTNTGNVALSNVAVADSVPGVSPAYMSGDTNSNSKLDLSETWVFQATGTAVSGAYSNIGTASGVGPADDKVTATDPSNYFGSAPGIDIDKVTNGADGLDIHIGDPVTWTYTVTNTGNVPLSSVTVLDSVPGVTPAYVSGDANANGKLDLTETWIFTASGIAVGAPYTNIGTASGFGPASDKVTATDDSGYFGSNPGIAVNKVTNGADGLTIPAGSAVTWTYTVTNTGNVALSNVSVTDSEAGVTPAYVSGDANSDGKLDLAETWVFEAHGTAIVGAYSNIGTASGFGPVRDKVTATDPSNYFGSNAGIRINKVTNGADGLTIPAGSAVTWTYTVTNSGNVALSDVSVSDSHLGVTPAYVSGDTNSNSKLDTTETWIYTASGTAVPGAYSNIGTASGFGPVEDKVTATDPSNYFGSAPGIDIDKVTNGSDGPFIHVGAPVTWTYTVTNTGNVALSSVTVIDSVPGVSPVYVSGDANSNGKLDLTEAWVFEAHGTATAGAYSNVGTASGFGPVEDKVTATDPSNYFGSAPAIAIDKVTNGSDGPFIHVGDPVTWTYTVTNAGNVALQDVTVTDSVPGVSPVYVSGDADSDGKLDLTETWVFSAHGVATAGAYSNIGTASGFGPADDKVTATDPSNYFGSAPAIAINKVTNGSDGPFIHVGDPVTWTYTVTNTGNVPLSSVTVLDSVPGVTPAYVSGDSNGNSKLDLGETWIYTASGIAVGAPYSNIGTASGFGPAEDRVSASDPSDYFGSAPAIAINKVTNGADGLFIPAGSAVTWTYTVTNTGNASLSGVTVIDSVAGVTPALVSGDTNSNGKLDLTETWIYTASGTAIAGAYSNVGTASGFGPANDQVTASDPSNYFGSAPDYTLTKTPNPTTYDHVGQVITYTYVLTNTGNVTLTGLDLTDNLLGAVTLDKASFAPGEIATGTKTHTVTQADLDAGSILNVATAHATPPVGSPIERVADAKVTAVQNPLLAIDKSTTTVNFFAAGDVVHYTYVVTNTGNVTLVAPFAVIDDHIASVDVSLVPPALAPGASFTAHADYTVTAADVTAGSVTNVAHATGMFGQVVVSSPNDTVTVNAVHPAIQVVKTSDAPEEGIENSSTVTYTYVVTNIGDVPLRHADLVDDKIGDIALDFTLGLGESKTFTKSTQLFESTLNIATVTAEDEWGHGVRDTDDENVETFQPFFPPDLEIIKDADPVDALPGETVTYTLRYRNIGEGDAQKITIVDDFDEAHMTVVDSAGGKVENGKITWHVFDEVGLSNTDGWQTITYKLKVSDDMPAKITHIDNTVVITVEGDTDTSNNTDDARVTVGFLPFTGGAFPDPTAALIAAFGAIGLLVGLRRTRREDEE